MFECIRRAGRIRSVELIAIAALGVVTVCSVLLVVLGRRFARAYAGKYAAMPRLTWMFHRTEHADLETIRKQALLVLPFYLAAVLTYLAVTGPLA
jgi:hypothetical protein